MNKRRFADICKKDAKPGYVLDKSIPLRNVKITNAVEKLHSHITACLAEICQGWGEDFKKFYIGKTRIKENSKFKFDMENPSTWRLDNGINARYCYHIKQDHGRNGLIVAGVVTRESIPESSVRDGSIKHQEEYALLLEKRLIQEFKKDCQLRGKLGSKLANKSTDPGKTDNESFIAYAVYIAFTMDSAHFISSDTTHPDSIPPTDIFIDLTEITTLECSPCTPQDSTQSADVIACTPQGSTQSADVIDCTPPVYFTQKHCADIIACTPQDSTQRADVISLHSSSLH